MSDKKEVDAASIAHIRLKIEDQLYTVSDPMCSLCETFILASQVLIIGEFYAYVSFFI